MEKSTVPQCPSWTHVGNTKGKCRRRNGYNAVESSDARVLIMLDDDDDFALAGVRDTPLSRRNDQPAASSSVDVPLESLFLGEVWSSLVS